MLVQEVGEELLLGEHPVKVLLLLQFLEHLQQLVDARHEQRDDAAQHQERQRERGAERRDTVQDVIRELVVLPDRGALEGLEPRRRVHLAVLRVQQQRV